MLRIHFLLVILFSCFMISSCLSANKVKSPHCPSLTIGEQITDLKIEPFIPYAVVLPHSAFYGSDYTVSLKLLSEHSPPKCWFTFDSYTLLVTFLADHDVINAQPRDGYLFEIEAKSRCDETKVRQQFRISIFDSTYITCMTLQIEIARTITKSRDHVDACAMDVLDDVLSRTQDYMSHESAGHSLSCLLQDYEIQDGRQVRFTMGYLVKHESECRHLCAKNFFEPYVARLVDRFGSINPRFDDLLAPVYTTSSAVADVRCNMFTTDSPLTTSVARTSTRPPPICTPPSISSQMDNVIIRNANRPHAIAIPQNLFKDQHTLSLSLYLPSDSLTICWFRFTSSSVHFFPTTTTVAKQPKDGYKFSLTATNSCGLSSTVQFNVKINQDVSPSCFYYQTEVVHSMNLCEETILKEFYHVLQNQMQQSVRISDIVSKTPMRSVINFTLISPTQDCSHCNIAFLDDLARRLNLQNLIRIFAHSNVLTKIVNSRFVITSPACKQTCQGVQKEISFNGNSGRIKEFTLPDNLRDVSLFDPQDPHICLLQNAEDSSKTRLLFLPPKPIHPYYAIHKYEYSLVEASSSCPIKLNMHTSRSKLVTCHEIRMKFKTIEDFSCSLDAVRNMVTLLIDYYRVQTSQMIIQSYQMLENNEIELIFSFDKEIIDCSACSLTLLKTYIGQLINSKGGVTTHFGNLIKNRFTLSNVTYLFNAHEQEHLSRFHESDDSNPIWLYMIPAWIILFLLLLLLLLCCLCCCCCGGGKKNIMTCLTSCCACCFGGRTKQRKIRRFNPAGDPSIRQISTNSIDLEKTMLSSTNHMKTHTVVQNLSSNNSSSNVGLNTNNQTVTYAVANKQKSPTHLNATPSLSNQSNKSNDNKLTSANMTSSKTAESCASNQKSSSVKTRNLSTKSTRKHVRSLSDGCLIEDDYLALPTPPAARKTSDVTRKSSHRASYRYRENADVSTSGRITIPIKITARVKNISKSLDDGLNREPVSRVKFTDKSETDDDPIISKYRSHERTILQTTPILSRRVLLDGEDRRSAFRTKSIDKETVTKRYPWQQDAETFRKQRTKTRKWSEPYLSDNSMTFFSDSNNVRLKKYSRNDQFL